MSTPPIPAPSGIATLVELLRWRVNIQPDAVPITFPADAADAWKDPGVGPDDLAFLQYTSGSTATPRGVMLSHANLLHNSAMIARGFDHPTDGRGNGVIWLPLYHDMGLIGGVLQPI